MNLFVVKVKCHPAVEVAPHKVSQDLGDIQSCDLRLHKQLLRCYEEVECVGNAMGKSAENEGGHSQQQRQHLALSCKLYGSSHNETAPNGE